ncbi:MAG: helix-turn-helix domain-containing protein [Candidatus Roizmanbacteria bacterium]|nr:helix-turn-helix domain-containing protein [Candidatus Roizmanbacteria bacterium]
MENQQKSYYAVIPAGVRYNKNISGNVKLLYGEISALCNQSGYCWASNGYFAGLYDVDQATVSLWIKALKDEGFIRVDLNKAEGYKRKIYLRFKNNEPELKFPTHVEDIPSLEKPKEAIEENLKTSLEKPKEAIEENLKTSLEKPNTNNTINNTINNKSSNCSSASPNDDNNFDDENILNEKIHRNYLQCWNRTPNFSELEAIKETIILDNHKRSRSENVRIFEDAFRKVLLTDKTKQNTGYLIGVIRGLKEDLAKKQDREEAKRKRDEIAQIVNNVKTGGFDFKEITGGKNRYLQKPEDEEQPQIVNLPKLDKKSPDYIRKKKDFERAVKEGK